MEHPAHEFDYSTFLLDRAGQAEAFDAIGERYDEAFPSKEGQVEAGEWLIRSLPGGARVLDLGCGTGVPTSRQLTEAGFAVVGVDLSERMVELARRHVPDGEFHRLDIADLRPGGPRDGLGPFDAVAAFFSLLMLPRAEVPLALATVRNLLVPGGLFALSMVEADLDYFAIPFIGSTIRVSGWLRDELREIVSAAGFEIVEESLYSCAPASADVPPEVHIFLHCKRGT